MIKSMSVEVKSREELRTMRAAGAIVAEVLAILSRRAAPGVSTLELDALAEAEIRKRQARPAFLGYRGYPATLCASINEEVVHGIPRKDKVLKEGDILSLDLGCVYKGFYGDSAVTLSVGKVSSKTQSLIRTTRQALEEGIRQMLPDRRVGDVGDAIQRHVEDAGFSVVREFVGHGIGRALHEDPPVPNYGRAGTGPRLAEGMVLAIEPMVSVGSADVKILEDGWTAVTADGSLSAHFEHTVAVTEHGPEILTLMEGSL